MKRRFLLLSLAMALTAGLFGCGSDDSAQINSVSRDFLTAIEKHDNILLRSTLTSAARSQTMPIDLNNSQASSSEPTTTELAAPNIQNNLAEIGFTTTIHGRSVDSNALRLRKEKDGWRVYAMVINADQNASRMVLDFEHPENFTASIMTQSGKAIGAAMKGVAEGLGGMVKAAGDSFNIPSKAAPPAK